MTELDEHSQEEILILKILAGEADVAEEHIFREKYGESEAFRNLYFEMKETWESSQALAMVQDVDVDKAASDFLTRVNTAEKESRKIRYRIAWAAGIAAAIVLGFVINHLLGGNTQLKIVTSNQITTVVLPDSSRVTINKNTTFKYPKYFRGAKREVALTGEAYFDISEDKAHPFIINTNGVCVKVWGTSFNVNSSAQGVVVSVQHGKVSIYTKNNEAKQLILTQGETGSFSAATQSFSKQSSYNQNDNSWATGIFTFNETPLCEAVKILGRHYQTTFTFQDKTLENDKLTAVFNHQSIDSILEILELTFGIKAVKQDSIVVIKKQ